MKSSTLRPFSPWRTLTSAFELPVAGFMISLGFFVSVISGSLSKGATAATPIVEPQTSELHAVAQVGSQSGTAQPLANGVYLYGQSSEPDQVGAAYMVFEVNNDQVVGAFYMPSSSFDCFSGHIEPEHLDLSIVSTYEQTTYPYEVALSENTAVASVDGSAPPQFGIEGFHPIEAVSENDQRILSVCKSDLQP